MKGRVIFLLEEPSMKVLLEGLLPRLFPGLQAEVHFKCVPHQGKSDLDKSIPIKLKAWKIPGDRFVILRDNDNADCVQIKQRFVAMCAGNNRPDTLVRLVCQELEAWYLGDLQALAAAYGNPGLNSAKNQKRFEHPDSWQKPSAELARLVPGFQKIGGARLLAAHLRSGPHNRAISYQRTLSAFAGVLNQMGCSSA